MSNAKRINNANNKSKSNKPTISQSIPVHFYKNYIPPKTPKINPMQPPSIPDFDKLPKISPSAKKAPSYSLTNKYPMSMPARSGLMGPNTTPFTVSKGSTTNSSTTNNKTQKEEIEQKNEPNSLEEKTKKLTVGSFTCFDVMSANSPLRKLEEAPDQKDNVSVQTNSTFASDKFADDIGVAPDDESEDEMFEMDM